MPILLDGNNLLYRLPAGQRSRTDVRRLVLDLVRHESTRVLVVFDGPPPDGSPERESLGRASVLYSGSRSADDVIIGRLDQARRPREWVVVTDDRALGRRAREQGAEVRGLARWQSKLQAAARDHPPGDDPGREARMSQEELHQWEELFSAGSAHQGSAVAAREDDDRPAVVPRRRRRRR